MPRPHVTKTLGPIHFEDLEPRRFEGLVRELIYDFRDWQSIEATGRGGSDDGFDVRAYERVSAASFEANDDESGEVVAHPMEGNVWMIQCKREKELGPTRVHDIIAEGVNPESPPYGYILVAPVNFSKKAYDTFRKELRERGVMEFYLWGRAELEDMLHQPKNDHILFAFFGISLVSRRRSRTTEIRAVVTAKNKLLKLFGENPRNSPPVLLRDTNDLHYPFKGEYKDFKERPRWKEYPVVDMHPLGLVVQIRKHFAYFDVCKKEWDYTDAMNLVSCQSDADDDEHEAAGDLPQRVEGYWEFLPRSSQAKFVVNGLLRFDAIAVIDGEGDSWHKFPHVFAEFKGDRGPFVGVFEYLELGEHHREHIDDLKRISKFPKTFPKPKLGVIHRDKSIHLSEQLLRFFKNGSRLDTIYDCDSRYDFLKPGDVIGIEGTADRNSEIALIQITNKRRERAEEFLRERLGDPFAARGVEEQIGRQLDPKDTISIFEFKRVYEWQLEKNGADSTDASKT